MTQYVNSPIHTYCVGQACSMGSLLLAAGEWLSRYTAEDGSGLFLYISRGEREATLFASCKHHDPSYVVRMSGSEM